MDSTILTALIAAGGVVVGALLAALASTYAASRKTAEIELSYFHKLRDTYLENARQFMGTIYVPLNIQLTALSKAYYQFRNHIDFEKGTAPDTELRNFRSACGDFISKVDGLLDRGADAYRTTDFDQYLSGFMNFLRQSLNETNVIRKRVFQMTLNHSLIDMRPHQVTKHIVRKTTGIVVPSVALRVGPIELGYSENEVLSAPLTSRQFEQRLQTEVPRLKYLIKEVTLGSHGPEPR
jgi:hypothetical protein